MKKQIKALISAALAVTLSLGTFGLVGCQAEPIVGPQGAQGVAGAVGEKGDTGPQGAKGDTGAKGEKGDTGAQGEKGDTGPQGAKGDTGAKGEKGDTGAQGEKGDTGPQGEKGDSLTGPSAYDIYVQNFGYVGSEAQWISDLVSGKLGRDVTVTFKYNDGVTPDKTVDIKPGTYVEEPEAVTRDGFEFVKWYANGDVMYEWDFEQYSVTQNIVLQAKWKELNPLSRFIQENNGKTLSYKSLATGVGQTYLSGYGNVQGGATDGTYGYYIVNGSGNAAGYCIKVDLETKTIVAQTSQTYCFGNGGPMCYNPDVGKLYVIGLHKASNSYKFWEVDPATMEVNDVTSLVASHNTATSILERDWNRMISDGITYNAKRKQYAVTMNTADGVSCGYIVVLDSNFNYVKGMRTEVVTNYAGTGGLFCDDNYIYDIRHNNNNAASSIAAISWDFEDMTAEGATEPDPVAPVARVSFGALSGFHQVANLFVIGNRIYASAMNWDGTGKNGIFYYDIPEAV